MKTTVVDYSEIYYSSIMGIRLPDKYGGKFVQLWYKGEEYMVFSPKEFKKYHSNIVELFSKDMNLAGAYDSEQKRFDIFEPEWKIIGGGKFEIDRKEKILRLYDDSMAYGRFNDEGLAQRLAETEELSGYRIVID
ncbi:MAG: hypothetical protein ACK4TF_04195 [Thermodesulfovibrionales bacterium]